MGNKTNKVKQKDGVIDSLIILCEKAIINSLESYSFSNQDFKAIPRVIIDIILQFSEHYKWTEWNPTWTTLKDKQKSKYLNIYDINKRQLRLDLLDYKGNIKSNSALKKTHFHRFEFPLDSTSRQIMYKLTVFRYGRVYSGADCTVIEGLLRIGFISNMYHKSKGKKLYQQYTNNQGFEGSLSNGNCFIGIYSHVIFDEEVFGLYKIDRNNNGKAILLSDDQPIEPYEEFDIIIEYQIGRVVIKRLSVRNKKNGKPRQYILEFPKPIERFIEEEWYPMISINPYRSRYTQIGFQLSHALRL